MRYSQSLIHSTKEAKEYDSINATLLMKAGFIEQVMAGVYAYLPLGLRVLNNIETIVREEMNTIGSELAMSALSPKSLWEQTDRLESIDVLMKTLGANEASHAKNDGEYILNSTHEELITPVVARFKPSYKDLPAAVYQIQTKFRNEERPKSGLLRGREFRMKDLYSFHASEEDFRTYYEQAKDVYMRVFTRLSIGDDTYIALASGGDFTTEYSHEFDTACETGEDVIYYDEAEQVWYNEEVAPQHVKDAGTSKRVSEVGNIFPLGTKFTDAFGYQYADENGARKPVIMGSYGIGTTRIMGVLVEKFHDERGMVWPAALAPAAVYLAPLDMQDETITTQAESLYEQLRERGIEVLYDDRDTSAGEKFADADLFGIPWRAVISHKTEGNIELKARTSDETELIDAQELLSKIELSSGAGHDGRD